jgi:hypothetical protein
MKEIKSYTCIKYFIWKRSTIISIWTFGCHSRTRNFIWGRREEISNWTNIRVATTWTNSNYIKFADTTIITSHIRAASTWAYSDYIISIITTIITSHIRVAIIKVALNYIRFVVTITTTSHIKVTIITTYSNTSPNKCTTINIGTRKTITNFGYYRELTIGSI